MKGNNMIKTTLRRISRLSLILLVGIVLLSCSQQEASYENLFDMEKIDLTDKLYAMVFSADLMIESDLKTGRNVLLLFDDDGNWDAYQTYNLDRANINWTKDGLYLSDYKFDYYIDHNGNINKSSKQTDLREGTAQYGSTVDDEGKVWSWFDIGFNEDSYETRLIYQDKKETREQIIEGAYNYFFTVGKDLYGVSSSLDLSNIVNKKEHLGLVKFTKDTLSPKVIAHEPLPDPDVEPIDISQQTVSIGDTVYIIGEAERIEGVFQTNLMKWNLKDGSFELGIIHTPTDYFEGELNAHYYYTDQDAIDGNQLYWFNERAELMKTNIDTFETKLIQSYDIDIHDEMFYTARFINDQVYLMVNDTTWGDSFKKDGTKMRLIKTSLKSPEERTTIHIKNGKELAKLFLRESLTPVQNSFSVRPTSQ